MFWFPGNDLSGIVKARDNNGYQKPYFTLQRGRLALHQYPVPEPEKKEARDIFTSTVRAEWKELQSAKRALADKQRGKQSRGAPISTS